MAVLFEISAEGFFHRRKAAQLAEQDCRIQPIDSQALKKWYVKNINSTEVAMLAKNTHKKILWATGHFIRCGQCKGHLVKSIPRVTNSRRVRSEREESYYKERPESPVSQEEDVLQSSGENKIWSEE